MKIPENYKEIIREAISDNWESVGIKTAVQVFSIIPSEFQVFLTIYDIPKDPDQYTIWHSTQVARNISKYSNWNCSLSQNPKTENLAKRIMLNYQYPS